MALPTLTYDWRFNVNQDLNSPGTSIGCFRQLLRQIKTTLITSSGWTDSDASAADLSSPWSVVASSNGITTDTSDLWGSDTDLVWNTSGNNHSWIVLRQSGINGNFEICLDLNSTSVNVLSLIVSFNSGFNISSLSTLNRPIASDAFVAYNAVSWITSSETTFNCALHVLVTDNGECNRIAICVGGNLTAYWGWDKPSNTNVVWTNPSTSMTTAINSTTFSNFYSSANVRSRYNNKLITSYLTCETYNNTASGINLTVANEITSEWPLWPIRLVCLLCPTGIIGDFPDLWWGSNTPNTGDTYPGSGDLNQFIHFGRLIHPWNKTTPLLE